MAGKGRGGKGRERNRVESAIFELFFVRGMRQGSVLTLPQQKNIRKLYVIIRIHRLEQESG